MSLPSNSTVVTSPNKSSNTFGNKQEANKQAFDLSVQEAIHKQMLDVVKE